MGYTEILMSGMDTASRRYGQAQTVFHTAERAASLTRQLLIFSSNQTPHPRVVDSERRHYEYRPDAAPSHR